MSSRRPACHSRLSLAGDGQRLEQGLGLTEGLLVLSIWNGVGDDTRPGLDVCSPRFRQDGSDTDGRIHVLAIIGQVTYGARVRAPAGRLQLVDDLHGADFRRAADGSGGEGGSERVHRCEPFSQLAFRPERPSA